MNTEVDNAVKQIQAATGKPYEICLRQLRTRIGNAAKPGNGNDLATNVADTIQELQSTIP